jgi:hypothetical protein
VESLVSVAVFYRHQRGKLAFRLVLFQQIVNIFLLDTFTIAAELMDMLGRGHVVVLISLHVSSASYISGDRCVVAEQYHVAIVQIHKGLIATKSADVHCSALLWSSGFD